MPKPKPDEIVRHEIVLGRTEREILETGLYAYGFNRVTTPLTNLLSSKAGLLLVTSFILYKLDEILGPNWQDQLEGLTGPEINDWFETQNIVLGGIGGLIGLFLGGPLGGVAGVVAGSATAEAGEYAASEGEKRAQQATTLLGLAIAKLAGEINDVL